MLLAGMIVVAVVETARQPHERTLTEPDSMPGSRAVYAVARPAAIRKDAAGSGSVSVLYRHRSAAFWAWRYRVRTRQLQDALHYARKLERIVRQHHTGHGAASTTTGYGVWDRLADCESGDGHGHPNWAANTGNGFYGGLQFVLSTWTANGGTGMPNQASREQQISVAERVLASQGWGAWPACSAQLGLR